jgi:hypothetical protein
MKQLLKATLVGIFSFFVACDINHPIIVDGRGDQPLSSQNSAINVPELAELPQGWELFKGKRPTAEQLSCANYSIDREWWVSTENGGPNFRKYNDEPQAQLSQLPSLVREYVLKNGRASSGFAGNIHVEPYEKGWLIGSDAGEWGGKLQWVSEDASTRKDLLKDNIRGILRVGTKTFVLSGMAHLDVDNGFLYEVVNGEVRLVEDFKTQPQTFALEGPDSVVIVFNNRLVRLLSTGVTKTAKEITFNSLYPNSATIDRSGTIYVGMRLFVVRFVPDASGYTEEWLVQRECQIFQQKNFDCLCSGSGTKV